MFLVFVGEEQTFEKKPDFLKSTLLIKEQELVGIWKNVYVFEK